MSEQIRQLRYKTLHRVKRSSVNEVTICEDIESGTGESVTVLVIEDHYTMRRFIEVYDKADYIEQNTVLNMFSDDGKFFIVYPYVQERALEDFYMGDALSLHECEDICVNLIIACIHVGVEYDTRHDMNQEKMADAFIRYGADVVIGNHPHSIQGIREQDGFCTLWSLGNFAFGGNASIVISRKRSPNYGNLNLNTFIAQITFSFDENNRYLGHQMNLIPCFVTGTGTEANNYQPIPVSGADAEKVLKAIQDDTPYKRLLLNPYVEGVGAVQDFVPAPVR